MGDEYFVKYANVRYPLRFSIPPFAVGEPYESFEAFWAISELLSVVGHFIIKRSPLRNGIACHWLDGLDGGQH